VKPFCTRYTLEEVRQLLKWVGTQSIPGIRWREFKGAGRIRTPEQARSLYRRLALYYHTNTAAEILHRHEACLSSDLPLAQLDQQASFTQSDSSTSSFVFTPQEESLSTSEQEKRKERSSRLSAVLNQVQRYQKTIEHYDSLTTKREYTHTLGSPWEAVIFFGDIHIENVKTKLAQLREDLELVVQTPDTYVVFLGDAFDNFDYTDFDKSGEAVLKPELARDILAMLWEPLAQGRKFLGVCSGDHEWFAADSVGYNPVKELCKRQDLPYLGERGRIILEAKGFSYKLDVGHKYQGSSIYNPVHQHIRYTRESGTDADLVAFGHEHKAAVMKAWEGKRLRIFIQAPTYKPYDSYGRKKGYLAVPEQANMPVAIFCRDRWEIHTFMDLGEGLKMLKMLNFSANL